MSRDFFRFVWEISISWYALLDFHRNANSCRRFVSGSCGLWIAWRWSRLQHHSTRRYRCFCDRWERQCDPHPLLFEWWRLFAWRWSNDWIAGCFGFAWIVEVDGSRMHLVFVEWSHIRKYRKERSCRCRELRDVNTFAEKKGEQANMHMRGIVHHNLYTQQKFKRRKDAWNERLLCEKQETIYEHHRRFRFSNPFCFFVSFR